MSDKYILNDKGQPVPEPDLITWGRWFEESREKRIVKQEWAGEVRISTIFLGLDHGWRTDRAPVLWETMTFSNIEKWNNEMDCCSGNREQAEAMHQRMVERVKADQ